MAFVIQCKGFDGILGGVAPFDVDNFGPAIYGQLKTKMGLDALSDTEASSFSTAELAKAGMLAVMAICGGNLVSYEWRIEEVP